MKTYTPAERSRLETRWSRDLVNRIVIALNMGAPVDEFLASAEQFPELPPSDGSMDFRGINFSHQNLRGPWTMENGRRFRSGVDLRGADFSCADLSWAILPHADLRKAFFAEADLSFAELILADLREADLSGARMQGAWLLGTKLTRARVTEAQLRSRQNRGQLDFDCYAYEI